MYSGPLQNKHTSYCCAGKCSHPTMSSNNSKTFHKHSGFVLVLFFEKKHNPQDNSGISFSQNDSESSLWTAVEILLEQWIWDFPSLAIFPFNVKIHLGFLLCYNTVVHKPVSCLRSETLTETACAVSCSLEKRIQGWTLPKGNRLDVENVSPQISVRLPLFFRKRHHSF